MLFGSGLFIMNSLWLLKRPARVSAGGSHCTRARATISGPSMTWSSCPSDRSTSSPWPTRRCLRWDGHKRILLKIQQSSDSPVLHVSLQNFYEKPAFDHPLNQMSVWLMLGNEGMDKDRNGSFCAHTPSAIVFGRSDGDRMAVTRDLALRPGYTLQFKVLALRNSLVTLYSNW